MHSKFAFFLILLEWYEAIVYGTIIPYLPMITGGSVDTLSLGFGIIAFSFIFRPIGAMYFASKGDRNKSLSLSLKVMCLSTFMIAVAPKMFGSGFMVFWFAIFKAMQSFALGGSYGMGYISTYDAEESKPVDLRQTNLKISFLQTGWVTGMILGEVTVFFCKLFIGNLEIIKDFISKIVWTKSISQSITEGFGLAVFNYPKIIMFGLITLLSNFSKECLLVTSVLYVILYLLRYENLNLIDLLKRVSIFTGVMYAAILLWAFLNTAVQTGNIILNNTNLFGTVVEIFSLKVSSDFISWGWRVPFIISGICAIILLVSRKDQNIVIQNKDVGFFNYVKNFFTYLTSNPYKSLVIFLVIALEYNVFYMWFSYAPIYREKVASNIFPNFTSYVHKTMLLCFLPIMGYVCDLLRKYTDKGNYIVLGSVCIGVILCSKQAPWSDSLIITAILTAGCYAALIPWVLSQFKVDRRQVMVGPMFNLGGALLAGTIPLASSWIEGKYGIYAVGVLMASLAAISLASLCTRLTQIKK